MPYDLHHADCLDWMASRAEHSVHAIVTDPPFALVEYSPEEVAKLREGDNKGIWRLPPKLNGKVRSPLPRFTVLTPKQLAELEAFFDRWAAAAHRILVPGAHVFIATTPILSHHFYNPLLRAGFEKRGEIVRSIRTLRGGDKPKNAEKEFHDVTVMPRGAWEPWGLFRKPCEGRVQDNLRKWGTGALRRESPLRPFSDMIQSGPATKAEVEIADHPSLKPQAFMRAIVRAALPLQRGTVVDTFMGSGSTIAAAEALGYSSIGVEKDREFFEMAKGAIPQLAWIKCGVDDPQEMWTVFDQEEPV